METQMRSVERPSMNGNANVVSSKISWIGDCIGIRREVLFSFTYGTDDHYLTA